MATHRRQDPLLGAQTLLQVYLDLKALTPDLRQWTEDQLQANPPRYIRFKRFMALLSAFDIPQDPERFKQGRFFEARSSSDTSHEKMWNMPTAPPRRPDHRPWELQEWFERLLRYREKLEVVLRFNHGVMEASGLILYAMRKTDDLNVIIRQHLPQIDDVLVLMINPEGKTIRLSDLKANFDYPDADLHEIISHGCSKLKKH